jgi:hypothetical protein
MKREIEVDFWVDQDEKVKGLKKSEWIIKHLDKHNIQRQHIPLFGNPSTEYIKSILSNLITDNQSDFVKNMKAAWSRAKYQEKNKNKNIALSDQAHKKLISLVTESKSSIKSTLENLILDNYIAVRDSRIKEKQEAQNKKDKEKREREEQRSIPEHRLTFSPQAKKFLENKIQALEDSLEIQEGLVKKQLLKILEYQEFIIDVVVDNELDDSYLGLPMPISNEQKGRAKKLFDKSQKA